MYVQIAPLGDIRAYVVSEAELDQLAAGSQGTTLLGIGYFLLGVAVSFTTSLVSTDIPSARTFTVFVVLATLTGLLGTICLLVGAVAYRSNAKLVAAIKGRMQEVTVTPDSGGEPTSPPQLPPP